MSAHNRRGDDFISRVNARDYAKRLNTQLARMKARPSDPQVARNFARMLWGQGGVAVIDQAAEVSLRYCVGKRTTSLTKDKREVFMAILGRGPDFAAAFKQAGERGKHATKLLILRQAPRRPGNLDDVPRCLNPSSHRPLWIGPAGVIGDDKRPLCAKCIDEGVVP